MRRLLALLLLLPAWASGATIDAASCSQAAVQTAVNAAATGDVVQIPSGSCTWTAGIALSKAITVAGAGGGYVMGDSKTSMTVGTGSKTFTVNPAGLPFAAGQTITVFHKADQSLYNMSGTVTSYSGTTLVVNVTSATGSGTTRSAWNFRSPGQTVLTWSGTGTMWTLTESAAGNLRLQDMQIVRGSGTGTIVTVDAAASGKPVVIQRIRFDTGQPGAPNTLVWGTLRGVISQSYFWTAANWPAGYGFNTHQYFRAPSTSQATWTQTTPAGAADTNGDQNLYIEDSFFSGAFTECADMDGGMRLVWRYNTFDNCGLSSHGQDTGIYGLRWAELYNNLFVFDDMSSISRTAPMSYFIFLRGGTGLLADNTFQSFTSQDFGDKPELTLIVENLRRNGGPYPCWNAGYPAPRQVGLGRVTGAAITDPTWGYRGDSEPIYIWGNTGTLAVNVDDYGPDECGGGPSVAGYIQQNRDYFIGTQRPGYTKYTYPHPLTSGAGPALLPAPTNLRWSVSSLMRGWW